MQMPKEIRALPWGEYDFPETGDVYVTGRYFVIRHERLLVLDFCENDRYARKKLWYRGVFSKKQRDFIILQREVERGKSKPLGDMLCIRPRSCYPLMDDKTERMLGAFFACQSNNHYIDTLHDWTETVCAEKEIARRKRNGDFLEDDAERLCPEELPEGLCEFVRREVIGKDNTIIYKKGGMSGVCALCGHTVRAARQNKFAQHQIKKCPDCGEEVICVLSGSNQWQYDYVNNVAAVQKGMDGTVWFRQWHVLRDDAARYEKQTEAYLQEIARYGMRDGRACLWQMERKEQTYMGRAYAYRLKRWEKSAKFFIYDGSYVLFTAGMADAVQGTALQYASLAEYHRTRAARANIIKYAGDFVRFPVMEFLWKAGYTGLLNAKIWGLSKENKDAIKWKSAKLAECFPFPLRLLKLKNPHEWDMDDVARLARVWLYPSPEKERIALWRENIMDKELERALVVHGVEKTKRYLCAQPLAGAQDGKKRDPKEVLQQNLRTYRDYLQECAQLNLTMTPDVAFPRDLHAAHARTMAQVNFERDKDAQEKFDRVLKRIEQFAWRDGALLIRPARSPKELHAEGSALHHCVGGYADRMANGTCEIYLIRRAEAPDTPYYTLERSNGRVVQCRTIHNRSYENDLPVMEFVQKWLAEIVNAEKQKKRPKKSAG